MSNKYLRKYNKATHEWELVSAPDISIDARLPEGSEITDNNVKITNENYPSGSTLNDALDVINDDISRLERNVSWLDSHKGEGGGGGGGSQSYSIVISSPAIEDGNKVFAKTDSIDVEFMIVGPDTDENCQYSYSFDNYTSGFSPIQANTYYKIKGLAITNNTHSFVLKAKNPYGLNIPSVSFNIYKSSLNLTFDIDTAGDSYQDGVFYVKTNQTVADIPMILDNGMEGAEITISASVPGQETKTKKLTSVSAGKSKQAFDFWKIVPKSGDISNKYFVVTFKATALFGGQTVESNEFSLRIKVINSDEVSITLGVNGIGGSEEPIGVNLNSVMRYSFKIYAPNRINKVYYAVKLSKEGGEDILLIGKYYSDDLHEPGYTAYTENDTCQIDTTLSLSYYISEDHGFREDDTLWLCVKVWDDVAGTPVEAQQELSLTAADNDVFGRQIPSRSSGSGEKDTAFAFWDATNANPNNRNMWISNITGYSYLDSVLESAYSGHVNTSIVVYDGNSSSGIITDGEIPYLRLQNHAYAISDLTDYEDEIKCFTSNRYTNASFTFSITFLTDASTNENKTILLWGDNNVDGELSNGIRVDANGVYWRLKTNDSQPLLSCKITRGVKKTVDFVYEKVGSKSIAKIYVDGVLNAAKDFKQFDNNVYFPSKIYFGGNVINNEIGNFSNINVYDFSIYSKSLNDLQLVVNGKRARLNGSPTEESVLADYNLWKEKNFITKGDDNQPISAFFDSGNNTYRLGFTWDKVKDIAFASNIPTLILNFNNTSFTKEFFYNTTHTSSSQTFDCVASYYDPDTKKWVENISVKISLQGTTTLQYKIKNLEMYMGYTTINGVQVPLLFQPREDWFPESQFTLKADVVDSAHANNAVLGQWINKTNILQPNPAMSALNASTRPKDVDNEGNRRTHIDKDGNEIDYHENVTIKHTLEGFPILLFIEFADTVDFNFLGIYSFNLGRYSFYNMGLKFLDSFSKRDDSGSIVACPQVIEYYTTRDSLNGTINTNGCYSFEFGNEGDQAVPPVWTQDDRSVVRRYGDFKSDVPVDDSNPVWDKLIELFTTVATSPISKYGTDSYNGYDNMDKYIINPSTGQYESTHTQYEQTRDSFLIFNRKININNAAAYFIIANAFGMTDSLGKNMVLRTWDSGNTWWNCFYDMDTALGLSNNGSEDVSVTVLIDTISMIVDSADSTTKIVTEYHSNGAFAGYKSKLWGLLRDSDFLYDILGQGEVLYETLWNTLRKSGGDLAYANNFIEKMRERIGTCGEIIYNCDYSQKYINMGEGDSSGTPTSFLHGTRIEYVNEWLKKHFYFLDGVFNVKKVKDPSIYNFTDTDSVLNNKSLVIGLQSSSSSTVVPFNVRVATPTFIGMTVGNDEQNYSLYYINSINEDTTIYYRNAFNKDAAQATIYGVSLITKFDGIQGMFTKITDTNDNQGVCSLFSSFDVSGSRRLADNSLKTNVFVTSEGVSALETINLSNIGFKADTEVQEYEVNLSALNNLLNVNISNSDITNIILPNTSLRTLSVRGSKINAFRLIDQNRISSVDLSGCSKINTIVISGCAAIEHLEISDLDVLTSLEISNCSSLTSLTIQSCNSLTAITITNNNSLKVLNISEVLTNSNLIIKILGGALTAITITETNCTRITFPSEANLSNVETLNLSNNIFLTAITIGNEVVPEYKGHPVFDFSKMTALKSFSLRNVSQVKYLRLPNNISKPFELSTDSIYGCTGIERIFGHLRVNKSSTFSGLIYFRVNDWDKQYDDYTPEEWENIWGSSVFTVFDQRETATNITFDSAADTINLQYCFSHTDCGILDVIYVFTRLNSKVTNIDFLFNACSRIYTEFEKSLPVEILSNCSGVTSAKGTFFNCSGINTKISSEMLAPIMGESGITSFDNFFKEANVYAEYDKALFPLGNKITYIDGFNPVYYNKEDVVSGVTPGRYDTDPLFILSNLSEVETISNSFNDIVFDGNGAGNEFKLLYGAKKLKNIFYSFNNFTCDVYASSNDFIKNILGKANSNYPSLEIIMGSFNNNVSVAIIPKIGIGNTFFGNSKNTIETVELSFGKLFKVIDFGDCGNYTFPYQILAGCNKLETCEELFKDIDCAYNNSVNYGVTIPNYVLNNEEHSMFEDCYSLKNISSFFSGMTNIEYSLNGNGFRNCQLENISNIFDNTTYKALVGGIPFKLFYQCDSSGCVRSTIKNMAEAFKGCNSSGCTYYTFNGLDTDLFENYRDENNEIHIRWNRYAFDGTRDFYERRFDTASGTTLTLEEIKEEYGLGEIPAEFSQGFVSGTTFTISQNSNDIGFKSDGREYSYDEMNEIFGIDNYFCPPDIFKYCANAPDTSISGAFYNTSNADGGIYGKIPEFLFEPISNINSIAQVFGSCVLLLPYGWGTIDPETEEEVYGERYPLALFTNLTNLRDLTRTFFEHRIFGKTMVNLGFLPNTVNSISAMLSYTQFIGDSKIEGNLYQLRNLVDISGFLTNSNVKTLPNVKFLTPENNPNISDCSNFMRSCNNVVIFSSIPEVWRYNYSRVSQYVGAFYGTNLLIQDQLREIGNKYIDRMLLPG